MSCACEFRNRVVGKLLYCTNATIDAFSAKVAVVKYAADRLIGVQGGKRTCCMLDVGGGGGLQNKGGAWPGTMWKARMRGLSYVCVREEDGDIVYGAAVRKGA